MMSIVAKEAVAITIVAVPKKLLLKTYMYVCCLDDAADASQLKSSRH